MSLLSSSRFLQYLKRRHILNSDILKCDALSYYCLNIINLWRTLLILNHSTECRLHPVMKKQKLGLYVSLIDKYRPNCNLFSHI